MKSSRPRARLAGILTEAMTEPSEVVSVVTWSVYAVLALTRPTA